MKNLSLRPTPLCEFVTNEVIVKRVQTVLFLSSLLAYKVRPEDVSFQYNLPTFARASERFIQIVVDTCLAPTAHLTPVVLLISRYVSTVTNATLCAITITMHACLVLVPAEVRVPSNVSDRLLAFQSLIDAGCGVRTLPDFRGSDADDSCGTGHLVGLLSRRYGRISNSHAATHCLLFAALKYMWLKLCRDH